MYERLRGSILAGQLEAGTRLPSTRVLASELGVSRTTTALAYELLLEGYIESRVGDGTRVARLHPQQGFPGNGNAHDLNATTPAETHPALLAARAQPVAVPGDREGLDVNAGRQLCPKARLVIVTPSHQFPTGVTMSLSRRLALLEWSREAHAWIVEDDYDSEYRFSGRPLEALHG